jgi:hypothetical protein
MGGGDRAPARARLGDFDRSPDRAIGDQLTRLAVGDERSVKPRVSAVAAGLVA